MRVQTGSFPRLQTRFRAFSTTNHPNPHLHVSRSSSHNHDEFLILTKSKPYASRSCTTITRWFVSGRLVSFGFFTGRSSIRLRYYDYPNPPFNYVSRSSSHNHDEFLLLAKSKPYASRSCTMTTINDRSRRLCSDGVFRMVVSLGFSLSPRRFFRRKRARVFNKKRESFQILPSLSLHVGKAICWATSFRTKSRKRVPIFGRYRKKRSASPCESDYLKHGTNQKICFLTDSGNR